MYNINMIADKLKDAILSNIGTLKPAPKNWQKRCCMLCTTRGHSVDKRFRFGIQFTADKILINCFNFGFSASYNEGESLSNNIKLFLKFIHVNDRFVKEIEFEIFKNKNSLSEVRDGVISKTIEYKNYEKIWHLIELPKDTLPITTWLEYNLDDHNFLNVVEYAISRKIYDLDRYYWCPSELHNLNQRLIIPYYYKHKMVGFTSRISYDIEDKSIPKYYQQCPSDFVFNLDNQQSWDRKYVILCEGVLDAVVTDGISSLGELSQDKIDIINRLQKTVIVCPDRDKKGGDLVDAAIRNNWAVSFPNWEKKIKDAAQAAVKYGRVLTLHSIISSALTDKMTIQLRWNLEQSGRNQPSIYLK